LTLQSGTTSTSTTRAGADLGGHGFAAISRQRLLAILRARCEEFGVTNPLPRAGAGARGSALQHDLVVGADGVNSITRQSRQTCFQPELDTRHARYMWLGTPLVFDAFKFFIAETDCGVVQAHAYPYRRRDEHIHSRAPGGELDQERPAGFLRAVVEAW